MSSSLPGSNRTAARQRSQPFLNLTFTALENKGASQSTSKSRRPSLSQSKSSSSANQLPKPAQSRNHSRHATVNIPSPSMTSKVHAESNSVSAPSSPSGLSRHRTRSLTSLRLDPDKEYFFTPSPTPTVLSPLQSPSPRPRKKSFRSAPSSPLVGRSPAGSMVNLMAMANGGPRDSLGLYSHHALAQTLGSSEEEEVPMIFTGSNPKLAKRPAHARSRSNASGVDDSSSAWQASVVTPKIDLDDEDHDLDDVLHPLPALRAPSPVLLNLRYISLIPSITAAFSQTSRLLSPPVSSAPSFHFLTIIWALLAAHQILSLTTRLLHRWLTYYPPFPHTLIRLLAIQVGILWPAQSLVLRTLGDGHMGWCVIGTTAAVVDAVGIWATSELRGSGGRKWEWDFVTRKCVLPAAAAYTVTAWWLMLATTNGGRGC